MSSVSYLFFTPVGRLVSHHSVIFPLLDHHLNLLILPFLSLSEYTIFRLFQEEEGGGAKINQSTGVEVQA